MPLKYDPPQRTILLCDYGLGGFKAPEMVKRRPVIVVSPRLRWRNHLVTVVPLSTTEPDRVENYHCEVNVEPPPPGYPQKKCWVKADMIATVCYDRLSLFRDKRDQYGKRKYVKPRLSVEDFEQVKLCISAALGF